MVVRLWVGAWWWVGLVLALGGLTGLDEAGGVEAGVDRLEVGKPVGYEPVPVLLAGQGGDCGGDCLEVLSGHVESLPESPQAVNLRGLAGGSASKLDVPRAVV